MRTGIFLLVLAMGCGGCATVSKSKREQVDQINQVGVYSYERAILGPPR